LEEYIDGMGRCGQTDFFKGGGRNQSTEEISVKMATHRGVFGESQGSMMMTYTGGDIGAEDGGVPGRPHHHDRA